MGDDGELLVFRTNKQKGKKPIVNFQVDVEGKSIHQWRPKEKDKDVRYPAHDILLMARDPNKERMLVISFRGKKHAHTYRFQSVPELIAFRQLVSAALIEEEERGKERKGKLNVFCGSWNVGEAPPPDDLSAWIPAGEFDIYAIAAQECEYTPREGFGSCEADWFSTIEHAIGPGYRLTLWPLISFIEKGTEATGIAHIAGNKGGIGVALQIEQTSLCFVGSHLAAHLEKVIQRNSDYHEIIEGLSLGRKDVDFTNQFDHVFWAGDLNYRIDLERSKCIELVEKEAWDELYEADQLHQEMAKDNCFRGFTEVQPRFRPTYQYTVGSSVEYSEKKMRVPSWCDRVLHKGRGLKADMHVWRCCDSITTSDHHPVAAHVELETSLIYVPKVLPDPFQWKDRKPGASSYGCRIRITNFKGTKLKIADPNGLSDPYVVFVAPYLSHAAGSLRAKKKSKTLNPEWKDDEISALFPLCADKGYLRSQFLLMEVWDYDALSGDDRMGQAVIPLREAVDAPVTFELPVVDFGKPCGTLSGVIALEWEY